MMKIRILLVLCLTMGVAKAQDVTGIKFEHELNWEQVKNKAKTENKYIFVDVFTTWCGPCKQMDRDVFPQEKVGKFFNEYFINVKVQADTTKKDSERVKKWYNDAKTLATTYNINSYPTFLFFNPKGELVHRLNEGSKSGDEFIAKAEVALSGYPELKWQFQNGKEESEFLLKLMKSAQLMNDREFIHLVTNKYLTTQKDLLTADNLKLISLSTTKTTDPGFAVLKDHADKADLVLGKGTSKRIVKTVVFDEIVLPHLRINGVKKNYGGMSSYTGEINKNVNWEEIERKLEARFPDLSEDLLLTSKPTYFQWLQNWTEYVRYISINKHKIEDQLLIDYSNNIFLFCAHQESLMEALVWTKELALNKEKKNTRNLYTYSCLLYKTGNKKDAIKVMDEAIELAGNENGHLIEILEKMKSGKRTW